MNAPISQTLVSAPGAAALLAALHPPQFVVHVGCGMGVEDTSLWEQWPVPAALGVDLAPVGARWQRPDKPGWQFAEACLAAAPGPVAITKSRLAAADSLLTPEALKALWPHAQDVQVAEVEATTLDALLAAKAPDQRTDWLIVDCHPAGEIFAGASKALSGIRVLWVAVAFAPMTDWPENAQVDHIAKLAAQAGLRCVWQGRGLNPQVGHALFLRDPMLMEQYAIAQSTRLKALEERLKTARSIQEQKTHESVAFAERNEALARELEHAREEAQSQISQVQEACSRLDSAAVAEREKNQQLQATLDAALQDLNQKSARIGELEAAVQQALAVQAEKMEESRAWAERNEALARALEQARAAAQSQIVQIQEACARLDSAAVAEREKNQQLQATLDATLQDLNEKSAGVGELEAAVQQALVVQAEKTEESRALSERSESLAQQLEQARAEVQSQIAQIQEAHALSENALAAESAGNQELHARLAATLADLNSKSAEVESLEEALRQAIVELEEKTQDSRLSAQRAESLAREFEIYKANTAAMALEEASSHLVKMNANARRVLSLEAALNRSEGDLMSMNAALLNFQSEIDKSSEEKVSIKSNTIEKLELLENQIKLIYRALI
jgi:hypothetical protein